MYRSKQLTGAADSGVALLIVLAFVVLLTGLVVAFLSRTSMHRQLAQSNFNEAKADILARGALDIIKGDIKQEINDGSDLTGVGTAVTYTPKNNLAVVPARSGNPATIPNLIRRSVRSDPMVAPGIASQASAVNSSTDVSINGRSVNTSRWNSHYLIPKADNSNDDPQPIAAFVSPDWVLVSRSGPSVETNLGSGDTALSNIAATNQKFVIGRYAYAVYDEAGLLDINVAGFPSPTPAPSTQVGRKGSVAFADLTALPTTASSFVTNTVINRIIGWRNYATAQPTGSFPAFTFSAAASSAFASYFLDQARDFRSVSSTVSGDGRTDQTFVTRAELIKLRADTNAGSATMLQYLGTFSRGTNLQTWSDSARRLKGRFPLSRFDLFTNPGNNGGDIKKYFAIEYVPASGPTPEHWRYTGAESGAMQSSIHVLTGDSQDPDLSVLLRYTYPASVSDGEILSIIASMIDQRDANLDTTWIEYGDPSSPTKAWGADTTPPPNPTDPRPSSPVILNRAFRNVGELGYAYRNAATTLDFRTGPSVDARLLDLFTYNTASSRAGIVNFNTHTIPVLAAVLKNALPTESAGSGITNAQATTAATSIVNATLAVPAIGREDVARLAGIPTTAPFSSNEESREAVARALAELGQSRTWGLIIDVVAQSGRYPTSANTLADFNVEGEKRYWLHLAIDRFTGQVLDQQLEAVFE